MTNSLVHIATDVGMHGLLASQSCYHSVSPPCWCTLLASSRFPYCCPSLHPLGFVRNLLSTCLCTVLLTIITGITVQIFFMQKKLSAKGDNCS